MSVRWAIGLAVLAVLSVAPEPLLAQFATPAPTVTGAAPPAVPRFAHRKKLVAAYDSVADSTHVSVVTHKGKYFLTIQRPRLTWRVSYAGRSAGPTPPLEVVLEFRTQTPQVASDNHLVIAFAPGGRLEVPSAGGFSDPGVLTWSHFMRFPISTASLAEALATDSVTVTVGGITERLKPDHVEALRDLLSRVGAWPAGPTPSRGA